MTDLELARFLFDRQAKAYDADPALQELAWEDVEIKMFWLDEARAIIQFLAVACA